MSKKHWHTNYTELKRLLRGSSFLEATQNYSTHITNIERVLQEWALCPQDKLNAFRQNQREFAFVLSQACTFMSTAFNDSRYVGYGKQLTLNYRLPLVFSMTPHEETRAMSRVEEIAEDSPPIPSKALQDIQSKLMEYADKRGYVFLDQSLHEAASAPYRCAHPNCSDDDHKQRAKWIYECVTIVRSQEPELEKLKKLSQQIKKTQAGSALAKHFQSRDTKDGISVCIRKLNDVTETRLTILSPENLQQSKELTMPPEKTNTTPLSSGTTSQAQAPAPANEPSHGSAVTAPAAEGDKGVAPGSVVPTKNPTENQPDQLDVAPKTVVVTGTGYALVYKIQQALIESSTRTDTDVNAELQALHQLCAEVSKIDDALFVDKKFHGAIRDRLLIYKTPLEAEGVPWNWWTSTLIGFKRLASGLIQALLLIQREDGKKSVG